MSQPEIAAREDQRELSPSEKVIARVREERFQTELAAALPENVPVQRFVRATATALLQNPALATADGQSFFAAVIRCAQDGLLPDGREAALVIFNSKVKHDGRDVWIEKVQYLPMVGGLRKIAAEYGWTIRSAVVHDADEFDYELGEAATLRHRPPRPGVDRGDVIAAYAVATHRDGRREIEVMDVAEIEKVRQVSRAKDRGPWVDWWERMAEKTPVKRVFAKLGLDSTDSRLKRILEAANVEPDQAAALLYGPDTPAPRAIAPPPDTPASSPPADAPAVPPHGGNDADHPPGDDPGTGGEGDQQDAGEPQAAAVSLAAPGDDEEPKVSGGFRPPESAIDTAGETVIVKASAESGVKGMTLAQVADTLTGPVWLRWALDRPASYFPAPFRASLELFVQWRLVDVWAEYVAARDGGEA